MYYFIVDSVKNQFPKPKYKKLPKILKYSEFAKGPMSQTNNFWTYLQRYSLLVPRDNHLNFSLHLSLNTLYICSRIICICTPQLCLLLLYQKLLLYIIRRDVRAIALSGPWLRCGCTISRVNNWQYCKKYFHHRRPRQLLGLAQQTMVFLVL